MSIESAIVASKIVRDDVALDDVVAELENQRCFLAARSFHSIARGNAQLAEFFATTAHDRPHPRWPERRIRDVFDEERSRLLALPSTMPETHSVVPASVDKTAFSRLDTNRYSVPARYTRRTLMLVADGQTVRLLDRRAHEDAARSGRW